MHPRIERLRSVWAIRSRRSRATPRRRPGLEVLEDRALLATIYLSPMDPDGSPHSLRAVLASLNPDESNTIVMTPGTLKLAGGELDVTGIRDLTIRAVQPGSVTIDAGEMSRDFAITSSQVVLGGLVLTGGFSGIGSPSYPGYGGGIYASDSTVKLDHSTVSGGVSGDYRSPGIGGGIYASNCTIGLDNSTVSGGGAALEGGGIATVAGSTLTLAHSSSVSGCTSSFGGGIYAEQSEVRISGGSTVSGNSTWRYSSSPGRGAGIYITQGSLHGDACYITGNYGRDGGFGGGIYAEYSVVGLSDGSAVSGNSTQYGGGLCLVWCVTTIDASAVTGNSAEFGGGIYGGTIEGDLVIDNGSDVSGNMADYGPDLFGTARVRNSRVGATDYGQPPYDPSTFYWVSLV